MNISNQQITGRGIAQRSGLDTLSSIIDYNGEYVNFGDAFSYGTQLILDTDYATETATPHIGALVASPASVTNQWYRYHSSGSLYTSVSAPASINGWFSFLAQKTGGLPSYCGMYQKLSLISGKEYKSSIQLGFTSNTATIYLNTYTPDGDSYLLSSTSSKTIPHTSGSLGLFESTFSAVSSNDIILIYTTTTETSSQSCLISNISIQEKQEYLVPVYATDVYGNAHKVLRTAEDQILSYT